MTRDTEKVAGGSLLQSHEEWDARNQVLFDSMIELIERFASFELERGLDVGCQGGRLTDDLTASTKKEWSGIDPVLSERTLSPHGGDLRPGSSDSIPFPDSHFDCLVLANVFEHIFPERRAASMAEMRRVLRPGGVVVGQIPNPYFPIESHSRLPFMGWLPIALQRRYWRLSPVTWEHDFYVVTMRHVAAAASASDLQLLFKRNFNYPLSVIPEKVRPAAKMLQRPMKSFPWSWQFVLKRPDQDAGPDRDESAE